MNYIAHSRTLWTSRLYEGEQDLIRMQEMLVEGRAYTNDWHYAHVGELLFNYFMVLCHLDSHQFIRLWHDPNGKLVGYAMLGEDPSIEWQVLPDYEWQGIEEEAFTWVGGRLGMLRRQDPAQWNGDLVSGSRQDDSKRIQFLEEHGFVYRGMFAEVNMLRPLSEPIQEIKVPPGYRVCSMEELTNIPDRAAAHREVWHPWTVGNVSDDDYRRFMHLPGYQPELDIVTLTPDGVVASFVNGWTDEINCIGDFGPVGTREAYRRQGLTRLALLEGLRRMKAHGMERVCISTGLTNTAALNLYASVGFKVVNKYLDYVRLNCSQSQV